MWSGLASAVWLHQLVVGPVTIKQAPDLSWTLEANAQGVEIDLDTLGIAGINAAGHQQSYVYPFRGQGKLSEGSQSQTVTIRRWPLEWSFADRLMVNFDAKRGSDLWHQRRATFEVFTHWADSSFSSDPGQPYILIPTGEAPAPKMTLKDGSTVDVSELVYRPLKLVRLEAKGSITDYYFSDGNAEDFKFSSDQPLLTHPWFDAIIGDPHLIKSGSTAWRYGGRIPMVGRDLQLRSSFECELNPVTISATYVTAKPRVTTWNQMSNLDGSELPISLQPVLTVFEVGNGKFGATGGAFTGHPSDREISEYFKSASDRKNFGLQAEFCANGEVWNRTWTIMNPNDLIRSSSMRLRVKEHNIVRGMTKIEVAFAYGMPKTAAEFESDRWQYPWIPGALSVDFAKGKVSKVHRPRLP